MAIKEVPLDNDWEFDYNVSRKATTTGRVEQAAGLSGVSAHFSLADGGDPISGTSTNLTERSAAPGLYYGFLDKAALNTALGALVDTVVFEVWLVNGDSEASEPRLVKATRRPA